ncbi:MAG: hypothetical protein K0R10_2108 [Alphaproteobacteria bacterium]|jgi:hypothetical protein|nr:hypothetical protein [Alphaproteobacteria bacterium]
MISFLKNFLAGEKSPEEKATISALAAEKQHDVLVVGDQYADESSEDEEDCAPVGGCGGCGCRS